ncbi:uncharacterized protein ACBT44_005953 [Syngnathus typhle]
MQSHYHNYSTNYIYVDLVKNLYCAYTRDRTAGLDFKDWKLPRPSEYSPVNQKGLVQVGPVSTCCHMDSNAGGGCYGDGQIEADSVSDIHNYAFVPGATSEGRGSAQAFLQDADARIKSQTGSCTQRGRKTHNFRTRGRTKLWDSKWYKWMSEYELMRLGSPPPLFLTRPGGKLPGALSRSSPFSCNKLPPLL